MDGREMRRSLTLSEHMSVIDSSSHLQDLLKVRDEDDGRLQSSRRSLTLESATASEKREAFAAGASSSSSRTLMDIMREEQHTNETVNDRRSMTVRRAAAAVPPEEPSVSGRDGGATVAGAEEEQPVRVSLLALLEQTDGIGDFLTEEMEEEERGGMYHVSHVCCACMVRHKGAAFIPCGHTFCRLCSRELWATRGNCPLCNGLILDILDIF